MNVSIHIETKQYDMSGNEDTISVKTQGTMYYKNNETYIVYKEKEDSIEVTNTIKISNDKLSIKKFGSTNSTMNFEEGKTDNVKYRTPQGLFIIENSTKKLQINTSNDIIEIQINYNIKIMDLFEGKNEITIKVIKNN